jgi:hypothetical protein
MMRRIQPSKLPSCRQQGFFGVFGALEIAAAHRQHQPRKLVVELALGAGLAPQAGGNEVGLGHGAG